MKNDIYYNENMYCDVNKYRSDKESEKYLVSKNLEELNIVDYIEFLNCNIELKIRFNLENLNEQGVELNEIIELSKKYYNPEHLALYIDFFDERNV